MIKYKKKGVVFFLLTLIFVLAACSTSDLNTREKEELTKKIGKTTFSEISFERILIESKFKIEDIYIEDFNVAINNEGFMESFNIIFTKIDTRNEFILMYRRENKIFKVIEQEKEYPSSNATNTKILNIIDDELIPLITIDKNYDAVIIDLMAPMPIELSTDTGTTYYNGTLINNNQKEKVEGLTFFSYKKPVESGEFNKYIFSLE
jgi:predicted nucleotide-binding protein (sugar kinase/HSP70/actin superfamily)